MVEEHVSVKFQFRYGRRWRTEKLFLEEFTTGLHRMQRAVFFGDALWEHVLRECPVFFNALEERRDDGWHRFVMPDTGQVIRVLRLPMWEDAYRVMRGVRSFFLEGHQDAVA